MISISEDFVRAFGEALGRVVPTHEPIVGSWVVRIEDGKIGRVVKVAKLGDRYDTPISIGDVVVQLGPGTRHVLGPAPYFWLKYRLADADDEIPVSLHFHHCDRCYETAPCFDPRCAINHFWGDDDDRDFGDIIDCLDCGREPDENERAALEFVEPWCAT